MFQNLARNATAAARPVKIKGVARFNVSSRANCDPAPEAKAKAKWVPKAKAKAKPVVDSVSEADGETVAKPVADSSASDDEPATAAADVVGCPEPVPHSDRMECVD